MAGSSKKSFGIKVFRVVWAYGLGTLSWALGFHCLRTDESGDVSLNRRQWVRHGLKFLAWVTALSLVARIWPVYQNWILNTAILAVTIAFLVKGMIFLYVKVFWPSKLVDLVPGLRHFFCPQCLRKQTFRFTPVSFRYGFFVSYLCRYCFCLTDGWGRQIFFPSTASFRRSSIFLTSLAPMTLVLTALGWLISGWIWNLM